MIIYKTVKFEIKKNNKKHFSSVRVCGRTEEELSQRCNNVIKIKEKQGYKVRG